MHLRRGRVVVSGVRSRRIIDVGWFVSALCGEDPILQHPRQAALGFQCVWQETLLPVLHLLPACFRPISFPTCFALLFPIGSASLTPWFPFCYQGFIWEVVSCVFCVVSASGSLWGL